jgi:hypothetical protein
MWWMAALAVFDLPLDLCFVWGYFFNEDILNHDNVD